ncbi:BZ3500_MvSof-1268-A1-R1_Chr9g10825 [Microbotryum saponariae]|uniref:Phosphotransferase n=1 Tax=Microbotryum saponariae TaxID=289078 RepID=A0A2X0L752_9BASI|nr:BZ3501_MvSof-1269-A2-R1_Chr9g10573 [Microbotryum saponariae]SDA00760.1 BZ3500_MvSof-1268-A1-R1_Chr9g10825 [Microbotryum saponariae]
MSTPTPPDSSRPSTRRSSRSEIPSGATFRRASTTARGSISGTGRRSELLSHFHRTHEENNPPSASKKDMAEWLSKLEHQFSVTPQRCRMIVDAFIETLERGLTQTGQEVPMIPTFVFGWPTGKEVGSYLAVDLGGTNLRVCHVELEGDGKFEVTQTKYRLTEEQKQGEGQDLIDFCSECLNKFIQDHYGDENGEIILEEPLALGFTFSYPCIQERIDHGVLLRWTKGFGAPNIENHDVAQMFKDSLKKFDVPVELVALINDTTGTLIASAYVEPRTRAGVIFGTGCNAAEWLSDLVFSLGGGIRYMEKISAITKIKDLGLPSDAEMAINCEWGAFDSSTHENLPRTSYDITIDESSNKPGEQAFEKMIAGLYLGEIFRLVMCEMIDEGVLFLGQETYKVEKPYAFDTAFLSLIESDHTDELLTVTGLFAHFYSLDTTIKERQFFRRLAQLIGTRAARLSACGIAAIVSKQGYLDEGCGVATDGSLYNKYPKFPERISEALQDIFGEKGRGIKTYHAEDGSGVGAAVIAAMTKARKEAGVITHV